jgi:hypothetical protein
MLVGLNDDGAPGRLRSQDARGGESVGVKVHPGGRGGRAELVKVGVEHKHVEGSTQELEDRYREVGYIRCRYWKVPVKAMKIAAHPRDGDVGIAGVREELERDRWQGLKVLAEESALHADPTRVGKDVLPTLELSSHQSVAADDAGRSLTGRAVGAMGAVESVHDVASAKVDGSQVLKEAT